MTAGSGGAGRTREAQILTKRVLDALRPEADPYRVPDLRCPGLAARIAASGAITWDASFRIKGTGKVRRLSLGVYPEVSLEAARERANALKKAARAGRDLLADEQVEAAARKARITVEGLIDDYVRRRVQGRLRTAGEIERRLKRALASILSMAAEDVRRRDIRGLLDAVQDLGHEREAEKRRQTIGAMFRWALAKDLVTEDPTAGLPAYNAGTPRERTLSPLEIRDLWQWLSGSDAPLHHRDVLRLQLATGARCGEIAGMIAEEIDTSTWIWTLPANRSKNGESRLTPIVGLAREILRERLQTCSKGPLFPTRTGKPLTSSHVGNMLGNWNDRIPVSGFTSHDLRRTVLTSMAESGISLDVVAAVAGHQLGGKDTRTLARHYVRTDFLERKRSALEAWDQRLSALITGERSISNVVPPADVTA